ncbi:hypothetical protein Dsin_020704 [Dipteronia sinensis]|uniref:CDC48 N-terminal subdomain domain-containing protein n=1 Tax=Dipteronia sinensis TaxID=43782 RepID=A0AAE0AAX7_9ROSI|nr:hypothetical protein Dsin_020704 [Dipteronia sinensis]
MMMSHEEMSCCFPHETKKRPNRLIVEEDIVDDNSVIALHPNIMEELGLYCGDAILIKGKRGGKLSVLQILMKLARQVKSE